MKKIIHVLNTNSFSGAENVAITIIQKINEKTDYISCYASYDGPINVFLNEKKIKHIVFEKLSVKNIKKIIRDEKPDILHCHDFTASVISSLAKGKSNVKIISHLHANPVWIRSINLKTLIYKICLKKISVVLAVSNSIFDEFKFTIENKKMISNPIDIKSIIKESESCHYDDQQEYDILFLGRLESTKDPLRFINIIAELQKKNKNISVAMVGDGKLKSECELLIKKLNLSDNIHLKGFKSNRLAFIKHSKILCVTSVWEGFGLMVIEALALSKPIVASPVGGLLEIINDKCGCFCSTNKEYVDELFNLLSDNDYYNQKVEASKKRGYELDNIKTYIQNLIEIYEKI